MKKYSRTLGWIGMAALIAGLAFAFNSKFDRARVAMSTGFFTIGTALAALHIWAAKR